MYIYIYIYVCMYIYTYMYIPQKCAGGYVCVPVARVTCSDASGDSSPRHASPHSSFWFGGWGLGVRVQGVGCRVQGAGCRV